MLTIGHLIATNFFGGPEKQIVTHAGCVDSSRFQMVLISFLEKGMPNEFLAAAAERGLATVGLPTSSPFDLGAVRRLRDILLDRKVNVLCSHGYKSNVTGRLATWLAGIPHVAVSRGWTGENWKIRAYERLDKLFLRLADRVVAVSHGQGRKVSALGVDTGRLSIIPNAIDVGTQQGYDGFTTIREELQVPRGALWVISAGRLSPEKNHAAMIEAARLVCAHRSDAHFAVFGEGVLRPELERRIREAGLTGCFLLPGYRRDLQDILRAIDIFMLPSFTEGLPNVVLEAFAARKPVIATAVGGTPELIDHGESGYLIQPHETSKMADHVLELCQNPALRELMGAAGFRKASDQYNFVRQTQSYEELYVAVYNGGHAHP